MISFLPDPSGLKNCAKKAKSYMFVLRIGTE